MICPKCTKPLEEKHYEGVEIDICNTCLGVWLDVGEITHIIETEEESFTSELIGKTVSNTFAGIPCEEKDNVVECPRCHKAMKSVNYNYSSGILIDTCSVHGVWLDHGELEKIQIVQEDWKKKSLASSAEIHNLLEETKNNMNYKDPSVGISSFGFINRIINFVMDKTS